MFYSQADQKKTFRQMMIYLILLIAVAAAGITVGLILGIGGRLSFGSLIATVCLAAAIFLFGNFFIPCYHYYRYVSEVLYGRCHLREGVVFEVGKKPVYKDNKNYYYEVLIETGEGLYGQFLYDANLGLPPFESGQRAQVQCYENFIVKIVSAE